MKDNEHSPIQFADLEPSRDLWIGIEAQLNQRRSPMSHLRVAGIAASFLAALTIAALWDSETPMSSLQRSAALMQSAHERTLTPLKQTEPAAYYQTALADLDQAESEILGFINRRVDDPALLKMLAGVHKRRVGILLKSNQTGKYS